MADTPANDPSVIAKLLKGLNSAFSDPNNAGTMGFAQGLLQASAPHMLTPVSMGQALGQGMASSQAYQANALQNAIQGTAILPFQQQRTAAFRSVLHTLNDPNASPEDKAAARALAVKIVGGDPMADPNVVRATTAARAAETPASPGQGGSEYEATHGINPVRGPTPAGTTQSAQTGAVSPAPGFLPFSAAQEDMQNAIGARYAPGPAAVDPRTGLSYPQSVSSALGTPQSLDQIVSRAQAIAGGYASPEQRAAAGQPPAPNPAPAPPAAAPRRPVGLGPSVTAGMETTQKAATQQLTADIQSGQEAQQQVAQLEELNNVASRMRTGPGAESRVAVQKALASLGGVFAQDASKLGSITDAQIFNKNAINFSLQAVSSAGQTAYNSMETVLNAVPSLKNTNDANAVVTAALLATARYKAAKGQFSSNWQTENNGQGFVPGKGSANAAWTKQAPFMAYFMAALPRDVQEQLVGAMKNNATLRNEILQARRAADGLQKNGYL